MKKKINKSKERNLVVCVELSFYHLNSIQQHFGSIETAEFYFFFFLQFIFSNKEICGVCNFISDHSMRKRR